MEFATNRDFNQSPTLGTKSNTISHFLMLALPPKSNYQEIIFIHGLLEKYPTVFFYANT